MFDRCQVYTDKSLGSDITVEEAAQSTCVLTDEEMVKAGKIGMDIICLIGNPTDTKLDDTFLLVGRVLPASKLLGKFEFSHEARDALFKGLKDKLPRNGY
jgi:hypothetical protein